MNFESSDASGSDHFCKDDEEDAEPLSFDERVEPDYNRQDDAEGHVDPLEDDDYRPRRAQKGQAEIILDATFEPADDIPFFDGLSDLSGSGSRRPLMIASVVGPLVFVGVVVGAIALMGPTGGPAPDDGAFAAIDASTESASDPETVVLSAPEIVSATQPAQAAFAGDYPRGSFGEFRAALVSMDLPNEARLLDVRIEPGVVRLDVELNGAERSLSFDLEGDAFLGGGRQQAAPASEAPVAPR